MKAQFELAWFQPTLSPRAPEMDRYFVPPALFPALLNAESTLVSGPKGYGKSTIAAAAQASLQEQWLNVRLDLTTTDEEPLMTTILRLIPWALWEAIETQPDRLARLQSRAEATRYFLGQFLQVDLEYLLDCLIDDFPDQAAAIQTFKTIQPRSLFGPTATDPQRLSILCDCVQKAGYAGVMLWLDLSEERWPHSPTLVQTLHELFDSLYLMRRPTLHVKCLAPPTLSQTLGQMRGPITRSVASLPLQWRSEQLRELVQRRLGLASQGQVTDLAQLINPQHFADFLTEFADATSPVEWLILTRLLLATIQPETSLPISEAAWLAVRRAYCAERVKLRLDDQGAFWRGNQLLAELNPRKRAIYPLVRYLYEHPGVHRTYHLMHVLKTDETNLNTMISRVRNDHLEPFAGGAEDENNWIYLVTDLKGGGYALVHTDRSP